MEQVKQKIVGGWKCKENCGLCCGPIEFRRDWFVRHNKDMVTQPDLVLPTTDKKGVDRVIPMVEGTDDCVFLTADKKCAVYDDRPNICKWYGLHPTVPCVYFHINGMPRSDAEQQLVRDYYSAKRKAVLEKLRK